MFGLIFNVSVSQRVNLRGSKIDFPLHEAFFNASGPALSYLCLPRSANSINEDKAENAARADLICPMSYSR
jgi:hypothetical protein